MMELRLARRIVRSAMDLKPFDSLLTPMAKLATRSLAGAEVSVSTVEGFVDLAFSWHLLQLPNSDFFTVKPAQVRDEITALLRLLSALRPAMVLEIGTAGGGSLYLFSKVASPDAVIISIDLPNGPFGGGYPPWKIPFYKSFVHGTQVIHLVRDDSHLSSTLTRIRSILGGELLDFLYIDGDHAYEGVKKDFEMYSPLVREGGMVAFHDIACTGSYFVGVHRFWTELKQRFPTLEIISSPDKNRLGIGIVQIGASAPVA